MENEITADILKDLGFVKADIAEFWERSAKYYSLRISDLIWLTYNLTDGFAGLRTKRESMPNRHLTTLLKRRNDITQIPLPLPFRKVEDLKQLLKLVSWEYRHTDFLNYCHSTPAEFR